MGKAFTAILREAYQFPQPEVVVIKAVVKEWLETVDLPDLGTPQATVSLLAALVDEPE